MKKRLSIITTFFCALFALTSCGKNMLLEQTAKIQPTVVLSETEKAYDVTHVDLVKDSSISVVALRAKNLVISFEDISVLGEGETRKTFPHFSIDLSVDARQNFLRIHGSDQIDAVRPFVTIPSLFAADAGAEEIMTTVNYFGYTSLGKFNDVSIEGTKIYNYYDDYALRVSLDVLNLSALEIFGGLREVPFKLVVEESAGIKDVVSSLMSKKLEYKEGHFVTFVEPEPTPVEPGSGEGE